MRVACLIGSAVPVRLCWARFVARHSGGMMKYLLIIVALIVAVLAALMYVPVKDGKPFLDPKAVEKILDNPEQLMDSPAEVLQSEPVATMYRWKDSSGNWQYGDRPPPGVAAEPVTPKAQIQRLETFQPPASGSDQ